MESFIEYRAVIINLTYILYVYELFQILKLHLETFSSSVKMNCMYMFDRIKVKLFNRDESSTISRNEELPHLGTLL